MPNLDGIGMLQEIHKRYERQEFLPYKQNASLFIMATCQSDDDLKHNYKRYGFHYYMQKPIGFNDLQAIANSEFEDYSDGTRNESLIQEIMVS